MAGRLVSKKTALSPPAHAGEFFCPGQDFSSFRLSFASRAVKAQRQETQPPCCPEGQKEQAGCPGKNAGGSLAEYEDKPARGGRKSPLGIPRSASALPAIFRPCRIPPAAPPRRAQCPLRHRSGRRCQRRGDRQGGRAAAHRPPRKDPAPAFPRFAAPCP